MGLLSPFSGDSEASTSASNSHEDNPFRDPEARYAAYTSRVAAVIKIKALSLKRYLAFTSDVGEAGRPVLPNWAVRATYGLTGAYIFGDITSEGYHAYKQEQNNFNYRVADTVGRAFTFQLFASLLIPFAGIHSAVHGTQFILRRLL